jgi:hypothetical protein
VVFVFAIIRSVLVGGRRFSWTRLSSDEAIVKALGNQANVIIGSYLRQLRNRCEIDPFSVYCCAHVAKLILEFLLLPSGRGLCYACWVCMPKLSAVCMGAQPTLIIDDQVHASQTSFFLSATLYRRQFQVYQSCSSSSSSSSFSSSSSSSRVNLASSSIVISNSWVSVTTKIQASSVHSCCAVGPFGNCQGQARRHIPERKIF